MCDKFEGQNNFSPIVFMVINAFHTQKLLPFLASSCWFIVVQSWRKLTVSGYYVNFKPKVLFMLGEYDKIPNQ